MSGYKDFVAGDPLTAAQVDGFLMRQSVMVFASASARDAALSGVLVEGMHAYTSDADTLWFYNGSAWRAAVDYNRAVIQAGEALYDGTSSTGYGSLNTFPNAFTAAPYIVATVENSGSAIDQGYYVKTISVSATSFRFRHYATSGYWDDSVTANVHWIAFGTLA
tara:strand:- start:129 stop:620 length:492 start_codon:yes stop_codon:yes gene_type:complete